LYSEHLKAQEATLSSCLQELAVGVVAYTKILKAQADVFDAQVELAKAQQSIVDAELNLLQCMGRLNGRTLGVQTLQFDPSKCKCEGDCCDPAKKSA
jgi:outer membrane protein TolC